VTGCAELLELIDRFCSSDTASDPKRCLLESPTTLHGRSRDVHVNAGEWAQQQGRGSCTVQD